MRTVVTIEYVGQGAIKAHGEFKVTRVVILSNEPAAFAEAVTRIVDFTAIEP